jgi:SNF2 family DNA or RNA helicase
MLDFCSDALGAIGVSSGRIDGTMTAASRAKLLREFGAEISGPRVILCSLRAAGVGLNLTRANHAFLMDPWWNASVEEKPSTGSGRRAPCVSSVT